MLSVTRLLCDTPTPGDRVRYGLSSARHGSTSPSRSPHSRPVVVWNVTRRCNLLCSHCYTASTDRAAAGELTTDEAHEVIRDLAAFGVPAILFSGGEPLARPDVFELLAHAASTEVQPVLSTNGTLLTDDAVGRLDDAGVARVGISIDGMEATNDQFRGQVGAFRDALSGIRRCLAAGFRVSVRFTLTRYNMAELDDIFDLVEREGVQRLCIYHLAYAGRGRRLLPIDLDSTQRRQAVDRVFERTMDANAGEKSLEVLTVDNHTDGAYLLLWAREHLGQRAGDRIQGMLTRNGGNSAGKGIGCIDERGFVHPDQFWRIQTVGNVRERPFSEIWRDETIPLLGQLRSRQPLLPQMCTDCRFLPLCNGNLRARAEAATGDPWGEDPACYLTDEERTASAQLVTA